MKKQFFLWIFLVFTLTGCHTIRPVNTPQTTILHEVPSLQQSVRLILDQEYRGFISKDRGNPLADPQKYMVGEALAPLTKAYFEQAASQLATYETLEEARQSSGQTPQAIYVQPKVVQFDNTMRLTEQRIDVKLAADIYDGQLKLIRTVQAQGMAQGEIFGNSVNNTVSTALQLALSNLIREIKEDKS